MKVGDQIQVKWCYHFPTKRAREELKKSADAEDRGCKGCLFGPKTIKKIISDKAVDFDTANGHCSAYTKKRFDELNKGLERDEREGQWFELIGKLNISVRR